MNEERAGLMPKNTAIRLIGVLLLSSSLAVFIKADVSTTITLLLGMSSAFGMILLVGGDVQLGRWRMQREWLKQWFR